MRFLRTNTAVRVTVGPFFDKTDGVTPETGITVTSCKLTFMVDDANVPTLVLDTAPTASGGANDMVHVTGDDAGFYDLELAAANVNYLGRAMLAITDAATHCPVFHEFMILPAMIYDSLVLGTDRLDTNVTHVADTSQTARDLGASVLLSSGSGAGQIDLSSGKVLLQATQTGVTIPTVTTLTNAPPDSSGVTTLLSRIPAALFSGITSLAQWLGLLAGKQTGNSTARTELRATGAGSGAYDETTDSLEANRDNLGTNGASIAAASVTGAVGSVTGNVGGNVVGSVGSVTGNVGGNVTGSIGSLAAQAKADVNAEVDSALDTAIPGSPTANSINERVKAIDDKLPSGTLSDLTAAQVNTEADQALADYDGPTHAELTSDINDVQADIAALNNLSAAQVNAEVDTALSDINLDHLVKSAVDTDFPTTVHLDSVIGQLADNGTSATFNRSTDSLEAIRDRGDAAWTTATGFSTLDAAGVRSAVGLASANLDTQLDALPTAAENADAVWDEAIAGHQGAGSTGEALSDAGGAGTPPTAGEVADAVWDEARAGHVSAGSFGEGVASVQGNVTGSTASVSGNVGGNVAGSVGSVTGNVGGNVTGSIGSLATQAKADVNAEADTALADVGVTTTVTGRIDAAISTRLASGSYTAPPSAATVASQVRTELTTELARVDVATSTRLATGTVASDVTAVKAKTDKLTFNAGNEVAANLESVNDVALQGNGTTGDPWGPA